MAVIVKENGVWKFVEYSTAPVDILSNDNLGFGTQDEKQMGDILKKRYSGVFSNHDGKTLSTNKGKSDYLGCDVDDTTACQVYQANERDKSYV